MLAVERMQKISDLVNEHGSMRVSDLSRILDISEVTIRRDLDLLAKENRLHRKHGGAIAIHPVADEFTAPELIRSQRNLKEKQLIARVAYDMINDKDTIFLDGSSTVNELAKLIAAGSGKRLYVISPAFNTVSTLAYCKDVTVIMLGGEVNYHLGHVDGSLATDSIRNMRADKCFLGINGIDESFGFSFPRFSEIDLKCGMMKSSRKSIVLADHTKFSHVYMARLQEPCDYLITDARIRDYDYQWLTDECKIVFADEYLKE